MARRLLRSTRDRRIAGVAGGLAEYFDIDSTIVRIAFVLTALWGPGLIAYIILWIALPEGEYEPPAARVAEERYARGEITAEELRRIKEDLQ